MRLGGGCSGQAADQRHRFMAAWAHRHRRRWGRGLRWRQPVQQGEHPLPLGGGGGAEEAEVADPLQAAGQHVLEEAVEEAVVEPQPALGYDDGDPLESRSRA